MTSLDEIVNQLEDRRAELALQADELHAQLEPIEDELGTINQTLRLMRGEPPPKSEAAELVAAVIEQAEIEQAVRWGEPPRSAEERAAAREATAGALMEMMPPKGKAYRCDEGCETAHHTGGYSDFLALRSHVKRHHDREPTSDERIAR